MKISKDKIISEIQKVYDPEIPVNIWDLGLIYDIVIKGNNIVIKMTLTSPTCPMADDIIDQIKSNIKNISNDISVDVQLVWEPVWDISRMSDKAKIELELNEQGW